MVPPGLVFDLDPEFVPAACRGAAAIAKAEDVDLAFPCSAVDVNTMSWAQTSLYKSYRSQAMGFPWMRLPRVSLMAGPDEATWEGGALAHVLREWTLSRSS